MEHRKTQRRLFATIPNLHKLTQTGSTSSQTPSFASNTRIGQAATGRIQSASAQWHPRNGKTRTSHRTVSLLREHPAVLRELGLIVQLAVPVGQLRRTTLGAPELVRIRCELDQRGRDEFVMTSPWTMFEFDGLRFLPAPSANRDTDLNDGMVDLATAALIEAGSSRSAASSASKWAVITFDVDGGVNRLRDAARTFASKPSTGEEVSLPALHSAGLQLVRRRRGDVLRERIANAARNNSLRSLSDLQLAADDLVLGYRVDIRKQSGDWFSLGERKATYFVDGKPIGGRDSLEEGHVKPGAVTLGADKVLRAGEVVVRWDGWSFATPKPIFNEDGVRPSAATRLPLPFDFKWEFKLANPLPRLRFGDAYRMRIRVADMAGGGLSLLAIRPTTSMRRSSSSIGVTNR